MKKENQIVKERKEKNIDFTLNSTPRLQAKENLNCYQAKWLCHDWISKQLIWVQRLLSFLIDWNTYFVTCYSLSKEQITYFYKLLKLFKYS
jgi:hypothetical protein